MAGSWTEKLAAAALLAALAAVGCVRLPLGFDLSDECCYAVAAQRHTLGDVPFRDTADGLLSMYDLALWPIFELRPEVTLLELRGVGLALLTAAYAAFWLLLSRHVRPWHAALACAAGFFALSNWFWTPGYNATFVMLTLLAVCLWLTVAEQPRPVRRAAAAFTAGVVWAVACACYVPMSVAALPAPTACVIGLVTRRMRQPFYRSAAWVVAGMTATAIAGLAVLASFNLLGPWWVGVRRLGTAQMEYLSAGRRAVSLLRALVETLALPTMLIAAVTALVAFVARRRPRAASVVYAAGIAAGLIAAAGLMIAQKSSNTADFLVCGWLVALAATLHMGCVPLLARKQCAAAAGCAPMEAVAHQTESGDTAWRRAYRVLLAVAAIGFVGQGFFSDTRLHSALAWTGPLLTLGLAAAFRRAERSFADERRVLCEHHESAPVSAVGAHRALYGEQPQRKVLAALTMLCLGCCALAGYAQFVHVYREAPLGELTAEFSQPRLRGLRSTPERVAAVEAVADFLNERLRPGETLLVGHSSCVGLHYLTGTRPALSAAWLSERLHPAYYEQLVADMVAAGRTPRYYVSTALHTARLGNPGCPPVPSTVHAFGEGQNAVHAYVRKHYVPIRTIYPFQIWQRTEDLRTLAVDLPKADCEADFTTAGGPASLDLSLADGSSVGSVLMLARGRLRVAATAGRFSAGPTSRDGRSLWTLRAVELAKPEPGGSRLGALRRALTGEPAPQQGKLIACLEPAWSKLLCGESQVTLTANVSVDRRNAAWFYLEMETPDGVQTERFPIPEGVHGNVGIETQSPPGTHTVRGGIEFVATDVGQELSIGKLRLEARWWYPVN